MVIKTVLKSCLALGTLIAAGQAWAAAPARSLPLGGQWRFAADPDLQGIQQEFFRHDLEGHISLPGSTDEARLGMANPKKPSLDGLYRPNVYEGAAWYQRDVEIPAEWRGKQISLLLERAHGEVRVWLDDQYMGARDSLIAPHLFDLGWRITPGKHRLTICSDNTKRLNLGRFVSINYEGTQTNWNGLTGRIELRAKDRVSIADVQVYPEVNRKVAKVQVTIANTSGQPAAGQVAISAASRQDGSRTAAQQAAFTVSGPRAVVTTELPMGPNIHLWDEFSPALYDLTVSLETSGAASYADAETVSFGMREFAARGTQFTINGRPVFLRGTLECGIFPRTGYPPTAVAEWQRIYRTIKAYGLNYIRFHSWCPPEAAFTAADLEGIMIQAEGPQANAQAGQESPRDAFMEQEYLRIVRAYGNHPSFVLMTLGNEFGGSDALLSHWVDMLIREDPRRLYSSASAAQVTANRQFTESSRPRGVQGPGTALDFRDAIQKQDRPLIGHEIGQWTFYPNFDEISKYSGVLQAKNFELVRDDLAAKHMLDLAPRFFQATGRHAVLLYKEEMELLMRTPGHAGFSLLDLHDYPGQGTALIGPLDPFWDSKGFVSPEQHRRYCGPVVPLLRMKKRVYTSDETFRAQADVAQFGPRDIAKAAPEWAIGDENGRVLASGSLPAIALPTGQLTPIGEFSVPLAKLPAPSKLRVSVALKGTEYANEWDIWVYPSGAEAAPPAGLLVTRNWSEAKTALAAGRKVLLFPGAVNPATSLIGKFLPVFWSPVWFPRQQPNTMGILCDPKHPALAQFPTDFYSNWQWWELIQNSRTVILDDAPATFRPIVGVIDNFARNHRLANLVEARVGEGRLLLCTIDLPGIADQQPAARQLLRSLYAYAASEAFRPADRLEIPLIDGWLAAGVNGVKN